MNSIMRKFDELIKSAPEQRTEEERVAMIRDYEAQSKPVEQTKLMPIKSLIDFPELHASQKELRGEAWQKAFEASLEIINKGGFVVLIGKRSMGKTQMAYELAKATLQPERVVKLKRGEEPKKHQSRALYRTALDIFIELRSTYSPRCDKTEWELMREYEDLDFMAIDEITVRTGSDFEDMKLTAIIDKRYAAMRPTVIIGNLTADELKNQLGKSVVARLAENGLIIECNWGTYRTQKP